MRPASVLVLLAVLAAPPPAAAGPQEPPSPAGDLVAREWLVLGPVDTRFRQPFNPSAPLAKYLLRRDSPPPEDGEKVGGDKGEATWRKAAADAKGTLDAGGEEVAWAYAGLEAAAGGVHLARLRGAAVLWVNGAAFPGDVYRLGSGPVLVELRKGRNDLFVTGMRGGFDLRFERWTEEHPVVLAGGATLPDIVEGQHRYGEAAVRIANPRTDWGGSSRDYWLRIDGLGIQGIGEPVPMAMAPLATRRVPLGLHPVGEATPSGAAVEVTLQPMDHRRKAFPIGPPTTLRIAVRAADEPHRVTFRSGIDLSVQSYAVLPSAPSDRKPEEIATVLSLHGASVDALDQARAYSPRPEFRIVCPTNRGRFGFDWQDWGREDAYEVLAHALETFGGDPRLVFLTGHSMGGHGTWHLAANDPGRWRAIAPSAGWRSFDTYGGGRPDTELSRIWKAADAASDTMALLPSLVLIPTVVVHGTKDDNVPVSEAEAMIAALRAAGGKPRHHFQEGAGHWWNGDAAPGADCVDGPWIFDLFREVLSATGEPPPPPGEAPDTMARSFKRAFRRQFVMVVGTEGSDEEDRELMERARYDAAVWEYRANGRGEVVRDSDFLGQPGLFGGRNVILYGNADTNAAWGAVVPDACPVTVRRGEVRVGDRAWKGDDLGCLFVHPRKGEERALVGVLGDTGPAGSRVGYGLLPFTSGVGYPDYAVFGGDFLFSGDGGVRAAGWFDHQWRLQPGGFVR